MGVRKGRDATVLLRMPVQTRRLIERAAAVAGRPFSAFVTESAARRAADILNDRHLFAMSVTEAEALGHWLDNPPPPTAKLRELMQGRAPWEE